MTSLVSHGVRAVSWEDITFPLFKLLNNLTIACKYYPIHPRLGPVTVSFRGPFGPY